MAFEETPSTMKAVANLDSSIRHQRASKSEPTLISLSPPSPPSQDVFQIFEDVRHIQRNCKLAHPTAYSAQIQPGMGIQHGFDVRQITGTMRDCLHDDKILGTWQGKLDSVDFNPQAARDCLSFEGKLPNGNIHINPAGLMAHQEDTRLSDKSKMVRDPGRESTARPVARKVSHSLSSSSTTTSTSRVNLGRPSSDAATPPMINPETRAS